MTTRADRPHPGAVSLLALVHDRPGIERSVAAAALGLRSSSAADAVAELVDLHLVATTAAEPTGRRGRPTTRLVAHPDGPVVLAVAVGHDRWEVAAVALGGDRVAARAGRHAGSLPAVAAAVRSAGATLARRLGARVVAVGVSVPGTVTGRRLVVAPHLGWQDVDLGSLRPAPLRDLALVAGNDATFAGAAEQRRGASTGAAVALHLHVDHGIGGVLVDAGRLVLGAAGAAGEYGHLPFGRPASRCSCGARGCWGTELDPAAAARATGRTLPVDEVAFLAGVLTDAGRGDPTCRRAARRMGRSLGRGIAGLVNALDPEVVTVGGLGTSLLDVAGGAVDAAYRRGLMALRATAAPPVLAASLGSDGPLLGAADAAFATLLRSGGLAAWAARA